jgi:hypothetical protein
VRIRLGASSVLPATKAKSTGLFRSYGILTVVHRAPMKRKRQRRVIGLFP